MYIVLYYPYINNNHVDQNGVHFPLDASFGMLTVFSQILNISQISFLISHHLLNYACCQQSDKCRGVRRLQSVGSGVHRLHYQGLDTCSPKVTSNEVSRAVAGH